MLRGLLNLLQQRTFSTALWVLLLGYGALWTNHSRRHISVVEFFPAICPCFTGVRDPYMPTAFLVTDGSTTTLTRAVGDIAGGDAPALTVLAEVVFYPDVQSWGLFAPVFETRSIRYRSYSRGRSPLTAQQAQTIVTSAPAIIEGAFGPTGPGPIYADLLRRGQPALTIIHPWAIAHDAIASLFLLAAFVGPFDALKRNRMVRRARVRAQRLAAGKCPRCLYDISATPARCPECNEDLVAVGAILTALPASPSLDDSVDD